MKKENLLLLVFGVTVCTFFMITDHVIAAPILFDNGLVSGPQRNLRNTASTYQLLYEDFTLDVESSITGINWQQFDHNLSTYQSTEITIYKGIPQAPGSTLVYSDVMIATRTSNGYGPLFEDWFGYDYRLDGLSIVLGMGTWWIGINQNHTGISPGWANTIGASDMIPGSRLINVNFPPPGTVETDNLAFNLEGQPAPVPEPATMLLFGTGLVGLAGYRKRKAMKK